MEFTLMQTLGLCGAFFIIMWMMNRGFSKVHDEMDKTWEALDKKKDK